MEQFFVNKIGITLDESNYLVWRDLMLCEFRNCRVEDAIASDLRAVRDVNKLNMDSLAMKIISCNISPKDARRTLECRSAYQMWTEIGKIYASSNGSRGVGLFREYWIIEYQKMVN
ncbi:hypothetical protein SSS_10006 [Sarcoptes scabiei]|nr:hypothetical protein SSS_10006 [Sarcoptes scabiei]